MRSGVASVLANVADGVFDDMADVPVGNRIGRFAPGALDRDQLGRTKKSQMLRDEGLR